MCIGVEQMNRFKRIFQNLTKTLLKPHKSIPETDPNHTKTISETDQKSTITLRSSNHTSDFPLRVFTVIGKQGTGKTTLATNIRKYYEQNGLKIVEVKTLEDLETPECVLLIDDLKDDVTKKVMKAIVEKFRVVRHEKQIIVLTHHILNDVPTKLLQLSEKVIFLHTNFSVNSPMSKIHHIIAKSRKNALHDVVLSLPEYEYVVLKKGNTFGKFSNMDIKPIVGDTYGQEIKLINHNGNKNGSRNGLTNGFINSTQFSETLYGKIPEFDLLTVTDKIVVLKQTFPRLKPRSIAQIVNTTPGNTWKTLSLARKNGLVA